MRPLLDDDTELSLRRDTLEHAIEDVVAAADATVLLILDQFEEHFLYQPPMRKGSTTSSRVASIVTTCGRTS